MIILPTTFNNGWFGFINVAGVAALLAQANPGARGAALWQLVTTRARRLALLSSADVGAGLVQAP